MKIKDNNNDIIEQILKEFSKILKPIWKWEKIMKKNRGNEYTKSKKKNFFT
jgi:hypothetical protein